MAKATATEKATDKTKAAHHSVTGSWNPSEFRFHQASADEVAKLFDTAKSVNDFRKLTPVLVRTHQGYNGSYAVHVPESDIDNALLADSKNPSKTNPGTRDIASLDDAYDTLVVTGQVKFIPNYFKPNHSDSPDYLKYHEDFIADYLKSGRLPGLIRAYLENIASGKILWRNKYGFDKKTFITARTEDGIKIFKLTPKNSEILQELADFVATYAVKPDSVVQLEFASTVVLGADAEVYPSQPFATDKERIRGESPSYGRVLATRDGPGTNLHAILSAQKVGNALRTIDTWYAEGAVEPIAIGVYGAVPPLNQTHRAGNGRKNSYYDLVKKEISELSDNEKDFLMAIFIKGGLLAFSNKKEKANSESKE